LELKDPRLFFPFNQLALEDPRGNFLGSSAARIYYNRNFEVMQCKCPSFYPARVSAFPLNINGKTWPFLLVVKVYADFGC